jgi:hypothetical protein
MESYVGVLLKHAWFLGHDWHRFETFDVYTDWDMTRLILGEMLDLRFVCACEQDSHAVILVSDCTFHGSQSNTSPGAGQSSI